MTIREARSELFPKDGLILELLDELPEDTEKLSTAEVAKMIFETRCQTILREFQVMDGMTFGLILFTEAMKELKARVGPHLAHEILKGWLADNKINL